MKHGVGEIMIATLLFTLLLGGMVMAKEAEKIGIIVVDFQADFTKILKTTFQEGIER